MAQPSARVPWPRAGIRWLWAMGLAVPIIAGIVLVALVLLSLTRAGYRPPTLVSAGLVEQYEPGQPRYFEQERIWMVELPSGEFLALYDVDPTSHCTVTWRSRFEFTGRRGWFRDACRGALYDLAGRCFDGPCTRGLDRFGVLRQSNEVIVDLTDVKEGPPLDASVSPVNPE